MAATLRHSASPGYTNGYPGKDEVSSSPRSTEGLHPLLLRPAGFGGCLRNVHSPYTMRE